MSLLDRICRSCIRATKWARMIEQKKKRIICHYVPN